MTIAILTLDPVNWNLAQRYARRLGIRLVQVEPRDEFPEDIDAAVIDLDHWCPERRRQFLDNPVWLDPDVPMAALSYYLPRADREALRCRRIHCQRRLQPSVLRALQKAAARRTHGVALAAPVA